MNKRIIILAGHYGSGKTNLAVNLALALRKENRSVCIADLDIVNPYFRTVDSKTTLEKAGVRLICSEFAQYNVDLPALPDAVYSILTNPEETAVLDVGGDDRGALALGRLREGILRENSYEMLCVVNFARPLTQNIDDMCEVMNEVQNAAGIEFTGIINNTNLGDETTPEYVAASIEKAKTLSQKTNLPLLFTSAEETVSRQLQTQGITAFPLVLQGKIR